MIKELKYIDEGGWGCTDVVSTLLHVPVCRRMPEYINENVTAGIALSY